MILRMASKKAVYEFEPDEQEILEELLPRNLSVADYFVPCLRMHGHPNRVRE